MAEPQQFGEIYQEVVDYLALEQTVYEQAVYHILLRKTHLESSTEVRIGQKTLARLAPLPSKVTTSNKGGVVRRTSQATIKAVIDSLARKGHIEIRDTTFGGTLYRVRLPRDIPECLVRIQEARRQQEEGSEEDFYTVPANRVRVFERDNYHCRYCEVEVSDKNATLDHVRPVSGGGDNSLENLVTCCLKCNAIKTSRSPDASVLDLLERYKENLASGQKP